MHCGGMLIPSTFDLSAHLSFLLSNPLSMHCGGMPILSTFDLSLRLGMLQWIVASRREGEEAERKEGKVKQKGREEAASYPHIKAVLNMRIILI